MTIWVCVISLTGEELPGLVCLPEVDGSLQNPKVGTGRVGELNQHVRHVEELQTTREEEIHINTELLLFDLFLLREEKQQDDMRNELRRHKTKHPSTAQINSYF